MLVKFTSFQHLNLTSSRFDIFSFVSNINLTYINLFLSRTNRPHSHHRPAEKRHHQYQIRNHSQGLQGLQGVGPRKHVEVHCHGRPPSRPQSSGATQRQRNKPVQVSMPQRAEQAKHLLHLMGQVDRSRIERAIQGTDLYTPNLKNLKVQSEGISLNALAELKTARLSKDPKDACSICLEEFYLGHMVSTLHCGHIFHPACIRVWLARSKICPLCKTEAPLARDTKVETPISARFQYEKKQKEILNNMPSEGSSAYAKLKNRASKKTPVNTSSAFVRSRSNPGSLK